MQTVQFTSVFITENQDSRVLTLIRTGAEFERMQENISVIASQTSGIEALHTSTLLDGTDGDYEAMWDLIGKLPRGHTYIRPVFSTRQTQYSGCATS